MNRAVDSAREVFESVADPYYFIDNANRVVFVNASALAILGKDETDLLDQDIFDVFPSAAGGYAPALFEQARRENRVIHAEYFSPSLKRVLSISVHPTSEGLGVYFRDQSQRRSDAARDRFLTELDDALRPLNDPDTLTITAARILGQMLGASRCAYADVEADQDTFNITGDYVNGVASTVGRYRFRDFGTACMHAMQAGVPWVVSDSEQDERCAGGREAYRQTSIAAVICVPLHKSGRFLAAMAVHQARPRDWTDSDVEILLAVASRCWESIERARLARNLRNTLDLLDGITSGTQELISSIDVDYRYTSVNPAYRDTMQRLYGARVEIGDSAKTIAGLTDAESVMSLWRAALAGEVVSRTVTWGGDAHRTFDMRVFPVRDSRGAVIGAGQIGSDVTARQREEDALHALAEQRLTSERSAREEAERLGRMKDEFLATLSHELRTPLNAILGWSQLLRTQDEISRSVLDGLDVIERNARVQAQLIEDLLDMNRIVSGKLRIDVQRVELSRVIDLALDTTRPAADAKGVRLESVLTSGAVVRGDPARLQQVFWNLLNNAIKFTPRGGKVVVALERVNSHVEVTVTDTGVGIAKEFLPFVFDRFRQADASSTRAYGGLGLGLSIVKELVELHGGRVRAASEGSQLGATFLVHLPVMAVQQESASDHRFNPVAPFHDIDEPVINKHLLDGVTVVAVDDEPDANELVRRFLESAGARVFIAASGAEGLGLVQRERPHVIVSDIGMPEIDGYDFIRSIRALPADQGGLTPATALTAFARSEDRRRVLLAGFQSHVVKPVEGPELVTVVASLAGKFGPA